MVRKFATIVMLALAVTLMAIPANAALVPMTWGFPTLVQDHTLTAFEKNFAQGSDAESATITFPSAALGSASPVIGTSSIFGASFPTITQDAVQDNLFSQTRFLQETEHFAFAYPYLSICGGPIPSLGFI